LKCTNTTNWFTPNGSSSVSATIWQQTLGFTYVMLHTIDSYMEFDVAANGKSMFAIVLATYKSSRNIKFSHGKPMLQRITLEDLVTQCYETSHVSWTRLFTTPIVMFPKLSSLQLFLCLQYCMKRYTWIIP